jgi:hypothetical protein
MPKINDRLGKYLAFDQLGNLVAIPGSSIDLFYSWVKTTESITIAKQTKKLYAEITSEVTLKLPIVDASDDGREISILNLDSNTHDVTIDSNSLIVTIGGYLTDTINPGGYRTYIYNHGSLEWIIAN